RRMPEARPLQVVVAHLDHPLRAQRYERQVLLRVPAATALGPLGEVRRPAPRVLADVDDPGLQLGEQLASAGHRKRPDDADRSGATQRGPTRRSRELGWTAPAGPRPSGPPPTARRRPATAATAGRPPPRPARSNSPRLPGASPPTRLTGLGAG